MKPNLVIPEDMVPKISVNTLKRLAKSFKETHFEHTTALYNFWEWKNSKINEAWSPNISNSAHDWIYFDFAAMLKTKFPSCYWKMSTTHIHAEVQILLAINDRYPDLAKFIKDSELVPFISKDGSHLNKTNRSDSTSSTGSSAVLCMPDIKQNKTPDAMVCGSIGTNGISIILGIIHNYIVSGSDASNAFAEASAPKEKLFVTIDEVFCEWYSEVEQKPPIPKHYVLPVNHALQGHPESPPLWAKKINSILTELSYKNTTHEPCLYIKMINGKPIFCLR